MAEPDRIVMNRHYERARTETFKETYRRRKAIVEPVFENLKWNKAVKIWVKGKDRVTTWWRMVCTAHNTEKMIGSGLAFPSTVHL